MASSSSTARSTRGGIRRLYSTLWQHAAGHRARLIGALTMLVVAQAIRVAIPFLFGCSVNALQAGDVALAAWFLLGMLVAALVAWSLHGPARVMERRTALHARSGLADALFSKVLALPLRWHETHHSGDTLHRIQKTTQALFGFAQHQFVYLQNIVSIVGPIAALLAISFATGSVALVGYGLVAFILFTFDKRMIALAREENAADRKYTSSLVDSTANAATVLTLGLQSAVRRMVRGRFDEVAQPISRAIVVNEVKWGTIDLLNNAMRTGLVALYGYLAWRESGAILVGTAVMVHQYAQQIGSVIGSLAGHWGDLVRQQTDIAGADDVFDARERAASTGPKIPAQWRTIEVTGLTFHHGERAILHDVSLTMQRGQRIALVGGSGAGKSTLLRVLAGLYESESGRVRIAVDGSHREGLVDLSSIALLVPQDPEVFESDVKHNLTLGLPRDDDAVARACRIARFDLPWSAKVMERGASLSGGQKQRLALARGLLAARGASLVLLDEPTSSVDPITEAQIYEGVFAELADACVVSSIHRLHLLPRFDVIVLLEDGRVVDAGALGELLERNAAFQQMWRGYVGNGNDSGPVLVGEERERPLLRAAV